MTIPRQVSGKFFETSQSIQWRSALVWAEHCTECAMPECFTTCEYYTPRPDMKCQRFTNGIAQVVNENGQSIPAFGAIFKRWGKLEAEGKAALRRPGLTRFTERLLPVLERAVSFFPVGFHTRVLVSRVATKLLRALSGKGQALYSRDGTRFYVETYNPGQETISVRLTFRDKNDPTSFFQKLLQVPSKYNLQTIPLEEMSLIDLNGEFLFQFEPILESPNVELYFGLLDFAILEQAQGGSESADVAEKTPDQARVKCVIWDLDNTLWSGTLIEDGPDGIEIREEARRCIIALDQRGILNSVASKNNPDDAMAVLEKLGLADYFLYPQVNWGPKSASVEKIQKSLNIGMNSLVFIDDQPFEREEVETAHPEIRVLPDAVVPNLLDRPEFRVPVTDESKKRRKLYQDQVLREAELDSSSDNYESFLRSCGLELAIELLAPENLPRIHELAQRTNQMNFSGNRYSRDDLERLSSDNALQTCVMSCRDKFGEYGIIGFAIIRRKEAILEDLMFSCRVQAKRIEHAFLSELIALYQKEGATRFVAHYSPTDRNRQAAQVFPDLGFTKTDAENGKVAFVMDTTGDIPSQDIVSVEFRGEAAIVGTKD